MRYVLLFVETEEFEHHLASLAPDARERAFGLVGKWFMDHADKIRGAGKLQGAHTATTTRRSADGELVVVDGPFVEGKEIVSGYAEVDVADLDEALKMVRAWPGCPVVEIRPLES